LSVKETKYLSLRVWNI